DRLLHEPEDDADDLLAVLRAEVELRHAQLVGPARLEGVLVEDARLLDLLVDPGPAQVRQLLVLELGEVELVDVLAALGGEVLADGLLLLVARDVVAPEAAAVAEQLAPDVDEELLALLV